MTLLAALLATAVPVAPSAHLTVRIVAPPEVHFNRRGDSTLTVVAGQYEKTLSLGGVPDPVDPDNVYLSLNPMTLAFGGKFGGMVKLKARLFLCDARNGICTVEELEKQVRLRPGQQLGLEWKVGRDTR
ncbi:hypothetical protein [Deinococcus frigens]|uniref:hypothetical protein n=1 Tax=Deinococcus frigens TaxID=249403 RepID=UPI0004967134|nr:hypothetical protein [Deinococcus frigens]